MSYYHVLNNDSNVNNHFLSSLQLFFFNKTLYSFFNTFCRNGKKGLTLKLVLLLLNSLKYKTLLSPILILKSVILNNKFFFKVNETKFRRRTFFSVSHLDPEHQISYSIGSLNRYLKRVVFDDQSDIVDTLTKFFLSFFLKDDHVYKDYINDIINSNQSINEVFSDLDEFEDRSISKSNFNNKNTGKIYLNTLFNSYVNKIPKKISNGSITLGNVDRTNDIGQNVNDSVVNMNSSKHNRKKVLDNTRKSKGKSKTVVDLSHKEQYNNNFNVFDLNGINISYGNEDFIGTSLEYLDISDIKLNQYFKNYGNLKNKIIYYFLSNQLSSLYLLMESVYNYIFNFTVDNVFEEATISVDLKKGKSYFDNSLDKERMILDRIKNNFHSEVEHFILWLIHVELKSNIGIDFMHMSKTNSIYKWMLYDRSFTSYLQRYYLQYYNVLNKLTRGSYVKYIDINSLIEKNNGNDNNSEVEVTSLYRKNIFGIFRNYIEVLKRFEEDKEKKKEIIKKLQEKEDKKRLIANIRNSFKKKMFSNVSRIINRILPHLIRQLDFNSNTLDYKKTHRYVSYKFKRMRVIGYY